MSTPVALAAPGLSLEAEVIAGSAVHGIEIRRRCVDAADLLGACMSAPGLVAIITGALPRLSPEVISQLRDCGSTVVGIAMDPRERAALALLGIDHVIDQHGSAQELLVSLASCVQSSAGRPGVWNLDMTPEFQQGEPHRGRLIAVWGPAGAPGRTTTAMVLSQALAEVDRTAIIDADIFAPSLALKLGLAEDLSGIILACRHAEAGSLSSRTLLSSMSRLTEQYFALTGLASSRRRAEVRASALSRVLEQVREEFTHAVIDVGASFSAADASAPYPASAADVALSEADLVVAVCHADPLGVARFLGDLPDLVECGHPIVAVITGGTQRDQARQLIRESASRAGVSIPVTELGLNGAMLTKALRRGRIPGRGRRWSAVSRPTAQLVELVA